MNEKQFGIICKKLDKIAALLTIQNINDKDGKIYALKKMGFTSVEVAPIIGITESGVRDTKGWKRK